MLLIMTSLRRCFTGHCLNVCMQGGKGSGKDPLIGTCTHIPGADCFKPGKDGVGKAGVFCYGSTLGGYRRGVPITFSRYVC